MWFGILAERGLELRDEFCFELFVKLTAVVLAALEVAADIGVEQDRVGDGVAVYARAADGNVEVKTDVLVNYAERDGVRGTEEVLHHLFGVEIVNALILGRLAAVGEALADILKGVLQTLAELAGEDGRLGQRVVGVFAGNGADLCDAALVGDDRALTVRDDQSGTVGNDVVAALGVG